MKVWKRFLALFMVALMVSSFVPMYTFAEESGDGFNDGGIDLSESDDSWLGNIPEEVLAEFNRMEGAIEKELLENKSSGEGSSWAHYMLMCEDGTSKCVQRVEFELGESISLTPEIIEIEEDGIVYCHTPNDISYTGLVDKDNNVVKSNADGNPFDVFYYFKPKAQEEIHKEITIVAKGSGEFIYDGKVHEAGDIDVLEQVLDGRRYRVDGVKAEKIRPVNVGEYVSTLVADAEKGIRVYDITDKTEKDVTTQFDVILKPATVIIYPCEVEITSVDASKVYDGEAFEEKEYQDYVVNGMIASRDKDSIQIVFAGSPLEYVGEYDNFYSVYSKDASRLKNYEFTCNYGKLTITPSPVEIISADASKIYDGEGFADEEYQKYKVNGVIAAKDNVQIVFAGSPYEVGNDYVNECLAYIKDEAAKENYVFTYKYGTLTILPAKEAEIVASTPNPVGPTENPTPVTPDEPADTPEFPAPLNGPEEPVVANTITNPLPVLVAAADNQFPVLLVEEPAAPEEEPVPEIIQVAEEEPVPEIIQVAEEETPLANIKLGDSHFDCILHLLLMIAAMLIYAVYTNNQKKLQLAIHDLEESIEERRR